MRHHLSQKWGFDNQAIGGGKRRSKRGNHCTLTCICSFIFGFVCRISFIYPHCKPKQINLWVPDSSGRGTSLGLVVSAQPSQIASENFVSRPLNQLSVCRLGQVRNWFKMCEVRRGWHMGTPFQVYACGFASGIPKKRH